VGTPKSRSPPSTDANQESKVSSPDRIEWRPQGDLSYDAVMHRFYLPKEQCTGASLELAEREAHHALHVLRVRRGAAVQVLDGAGQDLLCRVQETGRNHVSLQVLERRRIPPLSYALTLLQGLPKGKLFEAIIQKSTELGACRIVPLLTERTVTRVDNEEAKARVARWRLVAIEAIKQSGSAWLPAVEEPTTPRGFLDQKSLDELNLFGSLHPNARHPRQHLLGFQRAHRRPPRSVSVWIGPEGDFSPEEVGLLESAGVLPITLGRLVLRTETAATYCLSVLNYELQAQESVERPSCADPEAPC
jgi:16S rRNA (uracil1498-N3)-methyltransferase